MGVVDDFPEQFIISLTIQGSYKVLQSTVSTVLSVFKPDLDPTAVLDFLTACIHIPRLWQGRDQNLGKNSKPEDVLNLSDNSIKVGFLL